jgi:hypothetical protein
MPTGFWHGLFKWLLGFIEAWQQRRERDALVVEETQDDARIADQAAALDTLKRADGVPARVPTDTRKGRRPSAPADQ